jgi:small GTP-binding protein
VVIGDSGVGKTNLVSQFVDDKFLDDEKPTVGVEFSSKVVNICNHEIRCQIWDTAGQERFRAVTKAYYNGAVGALVVFDLANSKTFENIAKWIEEAEQNTKKETVILIIGNKADLTKREVSQSKVEELMSRKKGTTLFMETSALTGHNVREAFEALVKGIYEQKQREMDGLRKQTGKAEEEPSSIPPAPSKQNVITLKAQPAGREGREEPEKARKKCC